jgi:glycosyltransferase involved in cell wall biosynthesis
VRAVTVGVNLIEHAVVDAEDLAAKIEKLQRDPGLVKQYAEAGLAFARSLSWDALNQQWLGVIRSAAGGEVSAQR